MNRPEFDLTVTLHARAMTRFAGYLGAHGEPEDIVHAAGERLLAAEAFTEYTFEPDATRIPAWLRRALQFTILAARERWRRREAAQAELDKLTKGAKHRAVTDPREAPVYGGLEWEGPRGEADEEIRLAILDPAYRDANHPKHRDAVDRATALYERRYRD